MRKNIVLFRPDVIVETNKEYMSEVAKIFNLECIGENGSYFFIKKEDYNNAMKLKLEGKRILPRQSIRNYLQINRFDDCFVKVTNKFYPFLIDTVYVEHDSLYIIMTSSSEPDSYHLFDESEWVRY